jgi:hypothetical protein
MMCDLLAADTKMISLWYLDVNTVRVGWRFRKGLEVTQGKVKLKR